MNIDDCLGKNIVRSAVCVDDDIELLINNVIGYGFSDDGLNTLVIFNIIVVG